MTPEELDAIPEQPLGGWIEPVTDPATGITKLVRHPARFLVDRGDVHAYRDANGVYWRVGEDINGKQWKTRLAY